MPRDQGQPPPGSAKAKVRAYSLLFDAAFFSLAQAKNSVANRRHHCLHCLVDSAFSLEAYLNHIGPDVVLFWKNVKRLGPADKLAVVLSQLKLDPDFRKRPFRSVVTSFRARNMAAHASTEVLTFKHRLKKKDADFPVRPSTNLEKLCVLSVAEKVVVDIQAVIETMHKASGSIYSSPWWDAETEWTSVDHTPE